MVCMLIRTNALLRSPGGSMTNSCLSKCLSPDSLSGFLGGKEAVKPLTYPVVQYVNLNKL